MFLEIKSKKKKKQKKKKNIVVVVIIFPSLSLSLSLSLLIIAKLHFKLEPFLLINILRTPQILLQINFMYFLDI